MSWNIINTKIESVWLLPKCTDILLLDLQKDFKGTFSVLCWYWFPKHHNFNINVCILLICSICVCAHTYCQFYNPWMTFPRTWELFIWNIVIKEDNVPISVSRGEQDPSFNGCQPANTNSLLTELYIYKLRNNSVCSTPPIRFPPS